MRLLESIHSLPVRVVRRELANQQLFATTLAKGGVRLGNVGVTEVWMVD